VIRDLITERNSFPYGLKNETIYARQRHPFHGSGAGKTGTSAETTMLSDGACVAVNDDASASPSDR